MNLSFDEGSEEVLEDSEDELLTKKRIFDFDEDDDSDHEIKAMGMCFCLCWTLSFSSTLLLRFLSLIFLCTASQCNSLIILHAFFSHRYS